MAADLTQDPVSSGQSPLEVVLGEWMYVGARLHSSDAGLKLVLSQCYVSPSQQANATPRYFLIRNK